MKKRSFTQIGNVFLDATDLSAGAKLTGILIKRYADPDGSNSYPSADSLARKFGCDRKSVFRYLLELETKGYIFRTRIGGRNGTNTYFLHENGPVHTANGRDKNGTTVVTNSTRPVGTKTSHNQDSVPRY